MDISVELFYDLYEKIRLSDTFPPLLEVLTSVEIERMKDELSTPEILPCDFDMSIPGWLERIKLWGTITIRHKDPESFWGKRKITLNAFIKRIHDETLNKMFGIWTVEKKGLTKVVFYRDYVDMKNKPRREQFIVDVKLRKELR